MKVFIRNPDREFEMSGHRRVRDILAELSIDPDTVLVIRDGTLLTRDEHLAETDRLEVRPVISGGAGSSRPAPRCRRCRRPAVIELRRHNAAFCQRCFFRYFDDQVARAIKEFDMAGPDDRILVAVSGGKDSLALWDVLLDQIGRASCRERGELMAGDGEVKIKGIETFNEENQL